MTSPVSLPEEERFLAAQARRRWLFARLKPRYGVRCRALLDEHASLGRKVAELLRLSRAARGIL